MSGTKQAIETMETSRRVPLLRMVGAALAAGGLSAAVLVVDTAGAATSTVVTTTKSSKYGTILVSGKTVYTLRASNVACGSKCLKVWPALLLPKGVTMPSAGPGVSAASLGTVAAGRGALQVTYAGKPLYWFIGDSAPGQVHGNITDKWGKWSVVVTAKPSHASSGSGGTPTTSAGSGGVSF